MVQKIKRELHNHPLSNLVLAWFLCGAITILAGFSGWLYQPWSWLLLLPLVMLALLLQQAFLTVRIMVSRRQWIVLLLGLLLSAVWILHFTGVLVPETGFDAVWYHLPIIDQFVALHRIVYVPEYYQSVNPLFSDLIFLLGYQVAGEVGAKLVAYGLAISLALVSYGLARQYLNQFWSLLFVIQVSLIQVITWQASSFYVDVAKAMWEVAALYLLTASRQSAVNVKKNLVLSAFFFGASLATKQFSLLLLPPLLIIVSQSARSLKMISSWLVLSLLIPLPFYLRSWLVTGDPFFSLTTHVTKIAEIGSNSSVFSHVLTQLIRLPSSWWFLIFEARDYVSPLLLLLMPFVGFQAWIWFRDKEDCTWCSLIIWSGWQFLVWWLLPPLSTRYALSGFVTLLLLCFIATANWVEKNRSWSLPILGGILMISGFLLLPRLHVLQRNLKYISGQQTKAEYLQQFMDGNIDSHLRKWHELE